VPGRAGIAEPDVDLRAPGQFLPRGADLSQYTRRALDHIAKRMNDRPGRHSAGNPAEAFAGEGATAPQPGATRTCVNNHRLPIERLRPAKAHRG